MSSRSFQMGAMPMTPVVKALVISNVVIWLGAVLVLQNMILGTSVVFDWFALIPYKVLTQFYLWQFMTYMFLHSSGVFHVLFNMLSLWWFGSELEGRWGSRFFATYYLVCGVGAAAIYLLGTLIYYFVTNNAGPMQAPLVGASGATYGILLAYALLFGEREIYFMMLFPMKAKYFVALIGFIELVTLMDTGMSSQVANLAHLGGLLVGFVFLALVARYRAAKSPSSAQSKRGRKLKLVVNNDRQSPEEGSKGPKYWN
jgi:membrane associated rhomboid family serine protease